MLVEHFYQHTEKLYFPLDMTVDTVVGGEYQLSAADNIKICKVTVVESVSIHGKIVGGLDEMTVFCYDFILMVDFINFNEILPVGFKENLLGIGNF